MAYATVADLMVELGRPASSPAETEQWQSWLDRVERTIARRFTRSGLDLEAQVAAGAPTEQDVVDVEVAVVARRVNSAGLVGLTSVTRSIDDASITERRDGVDLSADPLSLTDDEWEILLPAKHRAGRAFSVLPS